jgi:riboflavin kinase
MHFTGLVVSGAGQGAHFVTLAWVTRELKRLLSFRPFPGTLNLRVPASLREALFSQRAHFLRIADPAAPGCPGYLERVSLQANGIRYENAWLILPEQSMHQDVLEIIAAESLRESLDLKEGQSVEILLKAERL